MNLSLPSSFEQFVQQTVAAGEFSSAEDVVCEGLRLLQQKKAWRDSAREKIEVGWEQAEAGLLLTPEQANEIFEAQKAEWMRQQGG